MRYVILWRNTQNNRVSYVSDNDDIAVFNSLKEVREAVENTTVCKHFPYQVVKLEMGQ